MQVNEGDHIPNQVVATRVFEVRLRDTNECDKILCQTFVFKNNEDFGNWFSTIRIRFMMDFLLWKT
jgi:hypothetical protein